MTLRRAILLVVVAIDALLLVVLWPRLRSPPRRVDDRVGLIPPADERQYNRYLEWVQQESGIDIHIVLAPDTRGLPPERFALATMRELGVGQETGGRGLLVLYDTVARTMRLEAGPGSRGFCRTRSSATSCGSTWILSSAPDGPSSGSGRRSS